MFAVNYNGIYMAKDHRNIIVFDTPEEAIGFINSFFNYATTRAFNEADKNPFIITEIAMAKNSIVIEERLLDYYEKLSDYIIKYDKKISDNLIMCTYNQIVKQ